MAHWNYETVDLAPFMQAGENTLAAVVWNFAEHMPLAQMSHKTGFIMQGNTEAEAIVNTDDKWKIIRNEAYTPTHYGPVEFWAYYVVGPGEIVEASKYPWGWEKNNFNDTGWLEPAVMEKGKPQETEGHAYWQLMPRTIPAMEHKLQRF